MARDPILFYDEVPLYESELDDNGVSQLTVKVLSSTAASTSLSTAQLLGDCDAYCNRVPQSWSGQH